MFDAALVKYVVKKTVIKLQQNTIRVCISKYVLWVNMAAAYVQA